MASRPNRNTNLEGHSEEAAAFGEQGVSRQRPSIVVTRRYSKGNDCAITWVIGEMFGTIIVKQKAFPHVPIQEYRRPHGVRTVTMGYSLQIIQAALAGTKLRSIR